MVAFFYDKFRIVKLPGASDNSLYIGEARTGLTGKSIAPFRDKTPTNVL